MAVVVQAVDIGDVRAQKSNRVAVEGVAGTFLWLALAGWHLALCQRLIGQSLRSGLCQRLGGWRLCFGLR